MAPFNVFLPVFQRETTFWISRLFPWTTKPLQNGGCCENGLAHGSKLFKEMGTLSGEAILLFSFLSPFSQGVNS